MTDRQEKLLKFVADAVQFDPKESYYAYDPTHDEITYGYSMCRHCLMCYYGSGKFYHKEDCPLKKDCTLVMGYTNSPDFVYVLGPKDNGFCGPRVTKEELKRRMGILREKASPTATPESEPEKR